jgi:hypothetical protein
MSSTTGSRALLLTRLALVMATASCAVTPSPGPEDETASLQLSLTQAPAEVRCLRLVVDGARRVLRTVDVMPGASTRMTFTGLPTGAVVLGAEAFAVDCASVATDTPAPWVGGPVTVTLQLGSPTAVTLPMTRNGRAHFTVDFVDDDTDAGPAATDGAGPAPDAGSAPDAGPCGPSSTCPTPPVPIEERDGRQYLFVTDGKTWNQAKDECARLGFTLASPADGAENAFIASTTAVRGPEALCWHIGFTDVGSEGTFTSTDGSSSAFRNFADGEPNNGYGAGENCVCMWGQSAFVRGSWNDLPCDGISLPFICKRGKTTSADDWQQ